METSKDSIEQNESSNVQIISFEPKYAAAFKALNEEWISQYFKMEAADYKSLDHPQDYILAKGGYVLMAILNNEPVGKCALLNHGNHTFELAKMAVSPRAKGNGIGFILGKSAIEKAKSAGGKKLYLESNTMLAPAMKLYYKLGFKEVTGRASPYTRCNIQMELAL